MPERKIFLLDKKDSPWGAFLQEFLEDTPSTLHVFHDAAACSAALDQKKPDLIFTSAALVSLPLVQKFKVLRQAHSALRLFLIGNSQNADGLQFDETFDKPDSLSSFQKKLVQKLPLPEVIRVITVDDEKEIGAMIRDFLENRTAPSFEVDYTDDGNEVVKLIRKKNHHVAILDVKMPIKDGREVYREIREKGLKLPVIVFFDAISGDEILDIHKIGRPAVVEKGARQSAMPEMMNLIKKMAYFG